MTPDNIKETVEIVMDLVPDYMDRFIIFTSLVPSWRESDAEVLAMVASDNLEVARTIRHARLAFDHPLEPIEVLDLKGALNESY